MTLYFFAFLSGVVTIFAPCIWPLLPIILSSGVTGGHKKPLGIVTGISVSFLFATLALAFILRIFPVDPELFRLLGVAIILLLGFTLLIPGYFVARGKSQSFIQCFWRCKK
jgi:cytochrome c-type biogenesis protein